MVRFVSSCGLLEICAGRKCWYYGLDCGGLATGIGEIDDRGVRSPKD